MKTLYRRLENVNIYFQKNHIFIYIYTLNLHSRAVYASMTIVLPVDTFLHRFNYNNITLYCMIFTFIARAKKLKNDIPIEMFYLARCIARICCTHVAVAVRVLYCAVSVQCGCLQFDGYRVRTDSVSFKSARVCLVKSNYHRSACRRVSKV